MRNNYHYDLLRPSEYILLLREKSHSGYITQVFHVLGGSNGSYNMLQI
jgi:hypothetical protein